MAADLDVEKKCSATIAEEDRPSNFKYYLHQLAGHTDDCFNIVDMEHSYSRPWNWHPFNNHAKPAKTLFVSKCMADDRDRDSVVDAENRIGHPIPPYDVSKARSVMEECEKLVSLVRCDDDKIDDWEELIDKTLWTSNELQLFNRVVRILNADRLARLANKANWNEPVLRRITIDKSARKFRQTLAQVDWKLETIQWLHALLMEYLSAPYLAAYFDILQTLKSKIPQLVERMISAPLGRYGMAVSETLNQLMKRSWDPVNVSGVQQRRNKLPGEPIIVVVPYCPGNGFPSNSRPYHWLAYLSNLGTLITVITPPGLINSRMSTASCLEQMINTTRAKISELRSDYPGRPIILVGLSCGAAIACQVALVEMVTAVVCLAFSLYTVDEKRGQPDDAILDLQCPVLFVIGQNASLSNVEGMEELREHMRAENGLIVVGGADDQLRISRAKKKAEGLTQSMVDRCILDEVSDFLGSILMHTFLAPRSSRPTLPPHPSYSIEQRRVLYSSNRIVDRKRKSSDQNDPDAPRTPAKRGRKPKKTADPKWPNATPSNSPRPLSLVQQQATTSTASGGTSVSTTVSVSVPSSSAAIISTSSSSSTDASSASAGAVICKPLTGLRLAASPLHETKASTEMKTVQLSIQNGIVRPGPAISATAEGGITVVGSAPVNGNIVTAAPSVLSSNTPPSTSKDIVIQVSGNTKSRLPITSAHSQLTSLSSLLQQPTPTIVLSPSKQREEILHKVSAIDQASLVEELTPDRILELPVIFEDQQLEEHQPIANDSSSTVKVILSNNSSLMKKQSPTKHSMPVIKYVKKGHGQQGLKYTKILLRKKDEKSESAPANVYLEEVNDQQLGSGRGPRIRHIPATQHSQFC